MFADAYVEPQLDTLDGMNTRSDVTGNTDSEPIDFENYRDTAVAGAETDLFWVTYLSSAFESLHHFSAFPPFYGDGDGDNEDHSLVGLTAGEVSIVYVETAMDLSPIPRSNPLYALQYYAVVAAHELGHQFGLARGRGADALAHREPSVNLMSINGMTNALKAGQSFNTIPFHPIDIAQARSRVHSPNPDPNRW